MNQQAPPPQHLGQCPKPGCGQNLDQLSKTAARSHLNLNNHRMAFAAGGIAGGILTVMLIAALGIQCPICNKVVASAGRHRNCDPLQPQAGANNQQPQQQPGGGNGAPGGLAQPVGQHPGQHLLPTGIDQNATNAIAQLYDSVFSPVNGVQIPLDKSIDPDALPPSPFLFKTLPQAQAFSAHVLQTANASFDAHNPISDKLFWYGLNYAPSKLLKKQPPRAAQAGNPDPRPPVPPEELRLRKSIKEMWHGFLSRANRALQACHYVCLQVPEKLSKLRSLLRFGRDPLACPAVNPALVPDFTPEIVRETVMRTPSTTSAGFGNWTYKDLQDLYRKASNVHATPGIKAWGTTLTKLVNNIAKGALDHGRLSAVLSSVKGIAIDKRDGKDGIRPIGVAGVFSSLTAKLLRNNSDIASDMRAAVDYNDMSHSIKGGSEATAHILRAAIKNNPSHIVIQLDVTNAFNALFRQFVLNIIPDVKGIGPFAKMMYFNVTNIFYRDGVHIQTDTGVTQGDPLGGFLFSAALSKALKNMVIPDDVLFFRFADDMYIVGPPEQAFALRALIAQRIATVGLELAPGKSHMWMPDTLNHADRHDAQELAPQHNVVTKEGIIACGAAVGTDAFVTDYLQKAFIANVEPCELVKGFCLSDKPGAAQNGFLLHRHCVNPALYVFLLRTHPPSLVEPLLAQVDTDLEAAVCQMMGAPGGPLDDTPAAAARHAHMLDRCHLNASHGGLNLPRMMDLFKIAYIGSISLAGPILRNLLTFVPRYPDIPTAALAFPEADALIQAGLGSPAGIDSIEQLYVPDEPFLKVQATLTQHRAQADYERIRDGAPDITDKALMVSQRCPEASAFLFAFTKFGQRISDNNQFRIAMREFSGAPTTNFFTGNIIPLLQPGQVLRCTSCNPLHEAIKPSLLIRSDCGHHANSCTHPRLRGGRTVRGARVAHAMADSVFAPNCNQPDGQHRIEHQPNLHNMGIPLKNPHAPVALNGNEIVKGDFLWVKPNGDRCIIDATSTAVCRTNVYTDARVSTVPGIQADTAARDKRTKYTAKYDWPANIPLLIPAFETSGRWSTDATTLIEKFLTGRFPGNGNVPGDTAGYSTAIDHARKCISVASRICVADAVMALIQCAYEGVFVPVDNPVA